MENNIGKFTETYVPKKGKQPSNNKNNKKSSDSTKTIEIRQVDVEKIIEKLPASDPEQELAGEQEPMTVSIDDKLKNIEKNGDGFFIKSESDFEKLADIFKTIFRLAKLVNEVMGPGHTENIYHKALEIELRSNGICYEDEKRVLITYQDSQGRNYTLGEERIDLFLVEYRIIIELKAVTNEPREPEVTQIRKYQRELLKAGRGITEGTDTLNEWGVIINFPQAGQNKKARPEIDFVIVRL